MAEKLRLAELELTKRQTAWDSTALREQLERVRNEKVSLGQRLQASEQRATLLESEKEDLARRLALVSLDKTAKKRWSETKQLTYQTTNMSNCFDSTEFDTDFGVWRRHAGSLDLLI